MVLKSSLEIAEKRANLSSEKYHKKIDDMRANGFSDSDIYNLLRMSDIQGNDFIEDAYNTLGLVSSDEFMQEIERQNQIAAMTDDQNQVRVFHRPVAGYMTKTDAKLEKVINDSWSPALQTTLSILKPVGYIVVGGIVIVSAVGCASSPFQPIPEEYAGQPGITNAPDAEQGVTKAPKFFGPPILSKTEKLEQAKQPEEQEIHRSYLLGELFDPAKPNMIAIQGSQTYDNNKNLKDINREFIADIWQDIGKNIDLRLWVYNNQADCHRLLKSAGETAVHTLDIGAGAYAQITDEIKLGIIGEYLRLTYENSGTQNQENVSAGVSARFDFDRFKAEINVLIGQGDGRFKDGSKFVDRNNLQIGGSASYVVSEDLGTVISAVAQCGRSDQEQLGTDWDYSSQGRAGGIRLIQTLFNNKGKGLIGGGKNKGIDLAVYGQLSAGNYDIGAHNNLAMQRTSAGFMFRLTPEDVEKFKVDAFLGVYQQNNYMNQNLPGTPRIENGFEAGLSAKF